MAELPPLPGGFALDDEPWSGSADGATDALDSLKARGVGVTSGFRTPEDVRRLKRQGYTPATNGAHNHGDGVDLVPGKSGMSLSELANEAQSLFGPGASASVHNGTHVHVSVEGWGQAPDVYRGDDEGLPPLPKGFTLRPRKGGAADVPRTPTQPNALDGLRATGAVYDGDTIGLSAGRHGRLFGVDAYEAGQQGRRADGTLVPLGDQGRESMAAEVTAQTPVSATGDSTYGRPVVTLGGNPDPAQILVREGLGLAEPQYLKGDPRFGPYMEAERQARMNRLGGHGTNAETPDQFRHKNGPWQGNTPGEWGEGQAVFGDERLPFAGLRPEIATGYQAVAAQAKTADELMQYAKANGFEIRQEDAETFIKNRDKAGGRFDPTIRSVHLPRPMLDPGDGAFGTFARGFGDPVNVIDELGGVVDTLGGTGGRENVWNSERRFGDILWNNIDQNRDILAHDEEAHPYVRLGGQVASGIVLPAFGAETALGRVAVAGAEGLVAGAGAGEGNLVERAPSAALGAIVGTAGGAALHAGIEALSPLARKVIGKLQRNEPVPPGDYAAVADEVEPVIARYAAMDVESSPTIASEPIRSADRIDVAELPPLPEGFTLDEPLMDRVRPMGEQATPEQMAALAERIEPGDVLPIPDNRIASLEEFDAANPGRFEELQAPDELQQLSVDRVGNGVSVRGPMDMTQQLRTWGGVQDAGGDLKHLGVTNAGRKMDFGSNEGFIGRLINDDGMPLDEAAERLWEAGYFPDFRERPTGNDLIERLGDEARGVRHFRPDDLAEVEAFKAARQERNRIEEAEQSGSPLVEERGQPVTEADLDANQPPAVAYKDLPTIGGRAGNIDLSKIEGREDIGRLLQQTEHKFGGLDAARRQTITHAETEALASELGMRSDDLLKRRQGQALSAEQALQARRILAKSGDELVGLARKTAGGSDEELAAFQRALLRHAAIQEQVTGFTAEAGRALNQFKISAKASAHRERVLKAVIEGSGGRDSLEDIASKIIELERVPGALNAFAQKAWKPSWKDKLTELYYNSILSGPQTHMVNILSNSLTAGLQLPEHLAAAALGAGRAAFNKVRGETAIDRVLMSEIGPRTVGMLQGAREGLRAFGRTIRTGEVSDNVTKLEGFRHEAIGGTAGKIVRVPTRLLSAEDELFKGIGRRMQLSALAVRKARAEGLKGPALKERIADLNANPTDEMLEGADDYARYLTFQQPLGPTMRHVQAITQNHPWLKLFAPFIRTPTNILKFAIERSPAALALKEVRQDFVSGGARRDLAVAKMALGTGLGLMVAEWVNDGHITGGGPADKNAKRLMMADGWQPYSVKVGDKYYSYRRLDPLATTIGVVADMVELQSKMTEKQREDVTPLVISSVMRNLANKTWLSGMANLSELIDDPQRSKHVVEQLVSSAAVPAGVGQTARTLDPTLRETSSEGYLQGIFDAVRARVPGASQGLLPRRDVLGQEIKGEGGIGPDLASPVWTSTDRKDPVIRELLRVGATIGPLAKPEGMSDETFDRYQALAGQLTRDKLKAQFDASGWDSLSPSEQLKAVEKAKRTARKEAREATPTSL